MTSAPRGFDRLARGYGALEWLAFGRDLERARFQFLDRLRGCRDVLILGEGDGRCLQRVVRIAPAARVRCVDASAGMLDRARERVRGADEGTRIRFELADARRAGFPDAAYDAVLTFFFLDCFVADDVASLVGRVQRSLRPGGVWLFADFDTPPRGWSRLRARLWLASLYWFFRWQAGIDAKVLPPSEGLLASAGLRPAAALSLRGGFIRSCAYVKDRSA
jgi:ubiquinone/menaquinone biosynthesis C-methylase UbiE